RVRRDDRVVLRRRLRGGGVGRARALLRVLLRQGGAVGGLGVGLDDEVVVRSCFRRDLVAGSLLLDRLADLFWRQLRHGHLRARAFERSDYQPSPRQVNWVSVFERMASSPASFTPGSVAPYRCLARNNACAGPAPWASSSKKNWCMSPDALS